MFCLLLIALLEAQCYYIKEDAEKEQICFTQCKMVLTKQIQFSQSSKVTHLNEVKLK